MRVALCLLFSVAVLTRVGAAEIEWSPSANMDSQLYPSLVISTATVRPDADATPTPDLLGDEYGFLGVSIKAPKPHTKVTVTVRDNAVMAASSWSGELEKAGTEYYVAPPINYKFDKLRRVSQQTPLTAILAVEVDGKPIGEKGETITVHSVNDCPYAVAESEETIDQEKPEESKGDDANSDEDASNDDASDEEASADEATGGSKLTDMGWMFAAYVNEGSSVVDKILKEGLASKVVNSFSGYQGKPDDVLREAFAIWAALQKRGLHYSSITTTPGGSALVHSQHVRFVEESLENTQANCVDGSVLFASVLRKLGLRTFLVIAPGHMYMGVYLTQEGDERIAIETTVLGVPIGDEDPAKGYKVLKGVNDSLDKETQKSAAWRSFEAAVAIGTHSLQEDAAKFESEDDANYQIIDVDKSRKDGIMPIGFVKAE